MEGEANLFPNWIEIDWGSEHPSPPRAKFSSTLGKFRVLWKPLLKRSFHLLTFELRNLGLKECS
jgi:hypothetical protein